MCGFAKVGVRLALLALIGIAGIATLKGQPAVAQGPCVASSPSSQQVACPKCGKLVASSAKFCTDCGTAIARAMVHPDTCPKCGKAVQPQAKFCPECGAGVTALTAGPTSIPQPAPGGVPADKPAEKPADKAAGAICLKRVVLLDQNDGNKAFTMIVPNDWKAGANITYRFDRPVAPADIAIRACSPDGTEEFNIAPQISATWSPFLAAQGIRRSLGDDVVQCPEKAVEFLYRLALPRLRPGLKESDVRVVETQDYDKAGAALTAAAPRMPMGARHALVARIRVEYKDPQTRQVVHEDITGTLWVAKWTNTGANGQPVQFTMWLMEKVYACRAPAGTLGRHADLFACMAASVRPDKDWMERYVRATQIGINGEYARADAVMKRSRIIAQNGREISQLIHDTYANHTSSQNHVFDQWAQVTRGTQAYVSPYETYPVEVPGGYRQVWTSGKGQYYLSNDVTFNPNQGSNVTWELMKTP